MSGGPPPRRTRRAPWRDRDGGLSPLKAAAFAAALLPGLVLVGRWLVTGLGPRPYTEAIHVTGLWAMRFVLVTLALTPTRAALRWQRAGSLRRMAGLAALAYALAHFGLYVADQGGALPHVAAEIARRLYLAVGFTALLGLAALGATSTDGAMRRLGRAWKRLHRLSYPIAALASLHYFMQTKADVSEAAVSAGLLAWLLLWRALPRRLRDGVPGLLLLVPLSWAATAGLEGLWYAVATRIPVHRVLAANLAVAFGPRPSLWVGLTALGIAFAGLAVRALTWIDARRPAPGLAATVALYLGGGALVDGLILWLAAPERLDDASGPWVACGWGMLLVLLAVARHAARAARARSFVDGFWLFCVAYPLYTMGLSDRAAGRAGNLLAIAAALALTVLLWRQSRRAAVLVAPVAVWLAYAATTLV